MEFWHVVLAVVVGNLLSASIAVMYRLAIELQDKQQAKEQVPPPPPPGAESIQTRRGEV